MINMLINELVAYGTRVHLVEEADKVYITNSLLELFEQMEFSEEEVVKERPLASILDDMCKYAFENGIIEDEGTRDHILHGSDNPYTKMLLEAVPSLGGVRYV